MSLLIANRSHVGADEEGISENNEKVGRNGQEYRRFFKERELVLCNNTPKCNGKWTRIQGDSKSILDLTVCTKSTFENMISMEIDENDKCSIESKKAKTDHKITFVKIQMKPAREKKRKKEILLCNGEWEKFRETLILDLNEVQRDMSYEKLEKVLKSASKRILKTRYKKKSRSTFRVQ